MSDGDEITYELHDVQVGLGRKQANVSLRSRGGGMIFVNSLPFDPPGEQSETELKTLALKAAKRHLKAALDAL